MPAPDDNALVKMRTLRAALAGLQRSIPRVGPGLGKRIGKDGEVWAVDTSQFVTSHPFKCPAVCGDGTVVATGQVNGTDSYGFPTDFTIDVADTGTAYIYLVATISLTTSAHGYVTGHTLTSWTLATGSTVPSDTSTKVYRAIARYDDGALTEQAITSSMEFVMRDDGSGTSTGVAIWGQA